MCKNSKSASGKQQKDASAMVPGATLVEIPEANVSRMQIVCTDCGKTMALIEYCDTKFLELIRDEISKIDWAKVSKSLLQ